MSAGMVYAWWSYLGATNERWWVAIALTSLGVSLSGSRVALGAGILLVALASVRRRLDRVARAAAGLLSGTVLGTVLTASIGARSAVDRATGADSGGRFDVWVAGWKAFVDDPIVGSGPALFRTAAQRHFTDEFATRFDLRGEQLWADPHNIVVNLAVGTGVVGVLLVLAFVLSGSRRSDRALLAVAVAVAATWLVQPMSIVTAPIAAFFFGLAAQRRTSSPESTEDAHARSTHPVGAVAVIVGLVLAAGLFTIDRRVDAAWGQSDPAELARAAEWYWRDPRLTAQVAERYAVLAVEDASYVPLALEYATLTAEYQSEIPRWWTELAGRQLLFGDVGGAATSLERALELQANYPDAWLLSNEVARRTHDPDLAQRAARRSCELAPDLCQVFVQP